MFSDKSKHKKNTNISPGSLGSRIKKYRELRGLSQKQLGLLCGYTPSTAGVRIFQYEKNLKVPRGKALKEIAKALDIPEGTLFDADVLNKDTFYHILFELEDFYGLHPVDHDGKLSLHFDKNALFSYKEFNKSDCDSFLRDWYEMRKKILPKDSDSSEQLKNKEKTYTLWRTEYPDNVIRASAERRDDLRRMKRLQAEMDEINAKIKAEDELAKIDAALERIMPSVKESYQPIERESEFIFIVKELIASHTGVYLDDLPIDVYNMDSESWHILSIKTDDILNDNNKLTLFARLECAFDTIQTFGIKINRSISSLNGVLYITYKCPMSQYHNFYNLQKYRTLIMDTVLGKGVLNDIGKQHQERIFKETLTNDDVIFPAKEIP